MAPQTTSAIILRTRYFSETSKLIDFITPEYGVLKTLGKGVLRPSSPMKGQIELFNHGRIFFYPSRSSDLHILGKFELLDNFPAATAALERAALFYYLAELAIGAGYGSDHGRDLFDFFLDILSRAKRITKVVNSRLWAEIRFLKKMGVFPPVTVCARCSRKLDTRIWFFPREDSWICPACYRRGHGLIELTPDLAGAIGYLDKNQIENIQNLTLSDSQTARLLMIIRYLIDSLIGREIKSRSFLDHLSPMTAAPRRPEN